MTTPTMDGARPGSGEARPDISAATILLIEDDDLVVSYFSEVFERAGCRYTVATTAAEGVQALAGDPGIDVVVTDLVLPDSAGTDILSALKPLIMQRPWIQAVVVTGKATMDNAIEALRLEAVDFLRKPVVPADLVAAIDRAVVRSTGLRGGREANRAEAAWQADLLSRIIKVRGLRARVFGTNLFSDPMWDMLLDLSVARLRGKQIYVTSLCIASGVPVATALRRIDDLEAAGLIVRARDPSDARRVLVDLSPAGLEKMQAYLEKIGPQALPV